MKLKDFIKANLFSRVNTNDFFELEKKHNELLLDYGNVCDELAQLKRAFNDSMMSLFIGESEVAVGQRNFYILIGLSVCQVISVLLLIFK